MDFIRTRPGGQPDSDRKVRKVFGNFFFRSTVNWANLHDLMFLSDLPWIILYDMWGVPTRMILNEE